MHKTRGFMRRLASRPAIRHNLSSFPRECEGNSYALNWSLVEDGIVSKCEAFRNARLPVLTTRLGSKVVNGIVKVEAPVYKGDFNVIEAGNDISHADYAHLLSQQQEYLSNAGDIFVEDASLFAAAGCRVGVRVITDSAAAAIITRSLLIKTPARPCDHRARYDGWNLDPRWQGAGLEGQFVKDKFVPTHTPGVATRGQRPVVAMYAGPGSKVAIQFAEAEGTIVGANISAGSAAPVRALVDAIGTAAAVVANARESDSVCLPSCMLTTGKLVVGASDAVVEAAVSKGILYGAYNNLWTPAGVSAGFGGVIAKAAGHAGTHRFDLPVIDVEGDGVRGTEPDNIVAPPKMVVLFKEGGKSGAVSVDEAVQALCDAADSEVKADAIKAMLQGIKVTKAGSAADAIA